MHNERCAVLFEVDRLALKVSARSQSLGKSGNDLLVGGLALQEFGGLADDISSFAAREHSEGLVGIGDVTIPRISHQN